MIFSNVELKATKQTFDFGNIFQICLGEKGRGRNLIALTCPEGTVIKNGMNPDYTIGTTKSGKPRIIKKQDDKLYFLISTEGGYTRRGNGFVANLVDGDESWEVLARGNGADGDAGRIGQWDALLLKYIGTGNAFLRVRTSGANYGTDSQVLAIVNREVNYFDARVFYYFCDQRGIELPCKLNTECSFDCLRGYSEQL